jgi:hypothetical protein
VRRYRGANAIEVCRHRGAFAIRAVFKKKITSELKIISTETTPKLHINQKIKKITPHHTKSAHNIKNVSRTFKK